MAAALRHPTWTQTYRERSNLDSTAPLAAWLLRLMSLKKTNLCLSADVSTSAELIKIAEEVGESICILKTHCDTVSDWTDKTADRLVEIAHRHMFLIFEDRKFADIGETVQKQYTGGYHRISSWSEITNAHILPGPAIVTSLHEAAEHTIAKYNTSVRTEISSENRSQLGDDDDDDDDDEAPAVDIAVESPSEGDGSDERRLSTKSNNKGPPDRKHSVVSVTTSISHRTESISPRPDPEPEFRHDELFNITTQQLLLRLKPVPYLRSLLLLAEMSSEGHLLTPEYSKQCVEIARKNPDYVMGFIAQRNLNTDANDNFLTMTPGCKLPPPGQEGKKQGDGRGQQYNTPRKLILEQGCDIIIVGRGIIAAQNSAKEAERYREEGWKAYEERVGPSKK